MTRYICMFCGLELSSRPSKSRHQRFSCPKRNNAESTDETMSISKHNEVKKKIEIKRKSNVSEDKERISELEQRLNQVTQTLHKLAELQTMKQQPTIVHNTYIQMFNGDIYSQLISKLGKDQAIKFLTSQQAADHPIQVLHHLFDPDNIPISLDNGKIQYLSDNQIIDDHQGILSNEIAVKIQRAMIHATNDLIKDNIERGSVDRLYEFYDIARIQDNLLTMTGHKIRATLPADINHPQLVLESSEF